ncbi:MAG: tRNA-dihydrouridine synthase family protein [Phycisphaerales bacterium]|nr:tRNA-dihydrouridine synthase family protein [Phycisphaerales bacterium]
MSVESHNATLPTPGIAPGGEALDPRRIAEDVARRCEADGHLDGRIPAVAPGFDAPFFQAGLAGYSDAAMRLIARRHGCPFCVTEALLDRTLLAGGRGFAKADLGDLEDNVPGGAEDAPLACQIMGSDPAEMAAAALKAVEQGRRGDRAYRSLAYTEAGVFPEPQHLRLPGGVQIGRWSAEEDAADPLADRELACGDLVDDVDAADCGAASIAEHHDPRSCSGLSPSLHRPGSPSLCFTTIDVNLACPVKKVKNKARGGHWLAEPDGAIAILKAVREAVPAEVACTVKMRRAFDDSPEMASNFDRILAAAFDMGYAWATVHARTVEQKYVGPSRWDLLRHIVRTHQARAARARKAAPIIFGSGDVWTAGDSFRMLAYTGVQGVAVARGCIGNPWIFRQARDLMAGREPAGPTLAEQRSVLEEHFSLALATNHGVRRAEAFTGKAMRKFAIRFAAHHPDSEAVRRAFIGVDSVQSWRRVLTQWYRIAPPAGAARQGCRGA